MTTFQRWNAETISVLRCHPSVETNRPSLKQNQPRIEAQIPKRLRSASIMATASFAASARGCPFPSCRIQCLPPRIPRCFSSPRNRLDYRMTSKASGVWCSVHVRRIRLLSVRVSDSHSRLFSFASVLLRNMNEQDSGGVSKIGAQEAAEGGRGVDGGRVPQLDGGRPFHLGRM